MVHALLKAAGVSADAVPAFNYHFRNVSHPDARHASSASGPERKAFSSASNSTSAIRGPGR